MAKREFIDMEKAENTTWEEPSYTDALNVLTEVRDKIRELPVITEQDIVKPYLEAIEAEAIKYSGTGEREIQAYDEGLLKAIEIIKNLLSEQEAKHGSN